MKVHIRDQPNMMRSVVGKRHRLNQISCGQSLFFAMIPRNLSMIHARVRSARVAWKTQPAFIFPSLIIAN